MLSGQPVIYNLDPFQITDTGEHTLGTLGMDKYGDLYRYVQAGASNVSAGKLQLGPAPKTNHHNVAVQTAVTANGMNKKVVVTLGATAAVANEYAGGMFCISDAVGEGTSYRIVANPAADASATLELTLERPIVESLTTASEVTLMHNTYNGVVEGTSSTQDVAGIPLVDITAAYYGWVKVRGIVAALADETITIGAGVTAGTSTAGAVEEVDQPGDTTVLSDRQIGWAVVAGVDTEYRPILLTLV